MNSSNKLTSFFCSLAAVLLLTGCAEKISPYHHATNWLIRQNDIPQYFAKFDVFCLPPAPMAEPDSEFFRLLPSEQEKILYNDARCLTILPFGAQCRIFIPKTPQISISKFEALTKIPRKKKQRLTDLEPLRLAITRASWALDYYFLHFHKPGHPFIIMGDGITSYILYEAMKECEYVTVPNGFVAAYLPGMPSVSEQQILKDFKKQKIRPAENDKDYGVIAAWTSTCRQPKNSFFTQPDNFQINPITWKKNNLLTSPSSHSFSLFYDWTNPRLQDRMKRTAQPCTAHVIPEQGRMQIKLVPELDKMPLIKNLDGIYHNWNLTFFIGNIVQNANRRTENLVSDRKWQFQKKND